MGCATSRRRGLPNMANEKMGDPADGQFNPAQQARINDLIDYFDRWPDASNMRAGQPHLLTTEIKRLRERERVLLDALSEAIRLAEQAVRLGLTITEHHA